MAQPEFPPGLRIVTSRALLTGEAGLVGVNTHELAQGALILAAGSLYRLDRDSTAVDDGLTVLTPLIGPGRWLLLVWTAGAFLSVADVAELAALGAAAPPLVWVETLKCFWKRETPSALTPDGITVVAAIGGGNWERLVGTTSPDFIHQATWYLDPENGDDEGSGSALSPIQTCAEWNRRLSVGAIQQDTEVVLLTDINLGPEVNLVLRAQSEFYMLTVRGTPVTVDTGTVAAFAARTHVGANPQATLLTGTAFDFSPYAGGTQMRIRMTNGAANGAIAAPFQADPGGAGNDVVRTSPFVQGDPLLGTLAEATPGVGDAFLIEALPYAGTVEVELTGPGAAGAVVYIKDIYGTGFDLDRGSGGVFVGSCLVDGCYLDQDGISDMVAVTRTAFLTIAVLGVFDFRWCTWYVGSEIECNGFTAMVMTACLIGGRMTDGFGPSGTPKIVMDDVQFFSTVGGAAMLFDYGVDIVVQGPVSGSGYQFGFHTTAAAPTSFTWDAGNTPNLKATTSEIRITSTTAINLAWATANFRNNEQHGVATLQAGTKTVAARNADTQGLQISRATPGGAVGDLSAPTASRTGTQFVINSVSGTDVSSVDWTVPGWAAPDVTIGLARALTPPV